MKTEKTLIAKHTPGPWIMEDFGEVRTKGISGFRALEGGKGVPITRLVRDNSPEGLANAALIAAAPDLLEALREADKMLDIAKRYFPRSIKNGDKFDLLNVQENVVRKAIAQAEGRAI